MSKFIRKDGARIEFTSALPDTVKDKYSEVFGRKLVEERYSSLSLAPLASGASVASTVFTNPCEYKWLMCFTLFNATGSTFDTAVVDVVASAGVIVNFDSTATPILNNTAVKVELDPPMLIGPEQTVWLSSSGSVSFTGSIALELHEAYRWVE